MAETFPIGGNIDPKAFPFLLMDLHHQGATGSLKVKGPDHRKALYYRAGRILFGSSDDPRDQLGSILIENGKMTAEQLAAVNLKVGPGNTLAKVVVESGYVSQREVGEAGRMKVERILSDVLGYMTGTFEFEDGVLPKGAVDLKLSTGKLVLAAVQRLADRGFVLEHLGSMGEVLAPVADRQIEIDEIRSEAGGLPGFLDGRRSLKDAAALAQLDEFEAAKIACALVFLGLAARVDPASLTSAPVFAEPELDLAETAALAFAEDEAPAFVDVQAADPGDHPFFVDAAAPADPGHEASPFPLPLPDPSPFPAEEESPFSLSEAPVFSVPEPEIQPPPVPVAAAEEEEDLGFTLPGVPYRPGNRIDEPAPASFPSAEDVGKNESTEFVLAPELETTALPIMGPPDATFAPLDMDSSIPGSAVSASSFSAEPVDVDTDELGSDPVTPIRPSKEDLAALDALLNPSTAARPKPAVEPLPATTRSGQWEPQFQTGAKARRPARRQTPPVLLIGLAVSAIAIIGGGSWYYLNFIQTKPSPVPSVAPPTAPPTTLALAVSPSPGGDPPSPAPGAAADPTPLPAIVPSGAATAPVTAVGSPAPTPLPTPSLAPTPSPKPAASAKPTAPVSPLDNGPVTDARSQMRKGSFGPAAKGFAANVKAATTWPFTVQLLVACSEETVQKALDRVAADELYILPVSYKGKSCNRVCWGLYETEASADAGIAALPAYFVQNGATPKVVRTTTLR